MTSPLRSTGDIGEALCHYRLLEMGVPCRIVILVLRISWRLLTTILSFVFRSRPLIEPTTRYENPKPYYGFNVCRGSKVKRRFEEHEIDIIACVGLDDGSIMFYPAKQLIKKKTHKVRAHLFEDYSITQETWEKAIRLYLGDLYIILDGGADTWLRN